MGCTVKPSLIVQVKAEPTTAATGQEAAVKSEAGHNEEEDTDSESDSDEDEDFEVIV